MKICDFLSRIDVDKGDQGEVIPMSFDSFAILNVVRKVTLSTANKLMLTARSATKAAGATLSPVHGVQKQLDPALKPEHDKHAASQNKQKGFTSADAKPKAVLKPRLPASQIAKKKLIDKSIQLLNKPKPQINLPKKENIVPHQKLQISRAPQRQQIPNPDNSAPNQGCCTKRQCAPTCETF